MASRDLSQGSIPRHVLALAGPAILSTLVHNLYGLNDVFFSKFADKSAFTQTAISNNLFTLIQIFGFVQLAAVGTLTLVSRRTGSKNEEGADRAARQGLIFAAVLSVMTAGIGLATVDLIPRLMGMTPEVQRESVRYLGVIFLGLPFIFLVPTLDSIFRARGDTRTPLLLHAVAVLLNIGGNSLAVFVFRAGAAGIAASTILSRLVWFAVGMAVLRRGRLGIRLTRRPGPYFDTAMWKKIAKVSAPFAAKAFLFGFVYQIVSRITADYGSAAQNGLGVGIRVEGLCFFIIVGFGMAAGPLVGQNLGAGRPDRASRAAWITVAMAMAPCALFVFVFLFLPATLMGAMTADPASAAHGTDYLRIVSACLLFLPFEVVLGQAFSGAGDTLPPMLFDVPLTAARIPLAWWLAGPVGLGPVGIWWAITATAIGRGALLGLWFLRGRWKRARPDLD